MSEYYYVHSNPLNLLLEILNRHQSKWQLKITFKKRIKIY